MVPGSYYNGFAPRDGQPLYPELWQECFGAWSPVLGPSGLVLRDWSARKNHATFTNMDAAGDWVVSEGRYALDFDGVNDYLQLANPALPNTSLWSFSAWCYFRTLAGVDSDPTLLNSGSAYLAIGSSSRLSYFSGGWRYFTGTVSTAAWTHIAFVRRATSSVEAYINGISLGSLSFNPGELTASTQLMNRIDAPSQGLDGLADSIMIHRRAITANEVRILASRRGIAHDLAPRRRSRVFTAGGFKAYWAARKATIIGGGL